jgi:hypothetical protein
VLVVLAQLLALQPQVRKALIQYSQPLLLQAVDSVELVLTL